MWVLSLVCISNLLVHYQKIVCKSFGGVGEGGGVPIFDQKYEIFDYGIDFQRFWEIFADYEIVFNAGGCKFGKFATQIVEKSVLALREQNCVDERFFVVQVIENVRYKVLVIEYRRF